jgi:polyisoprenoid-binding protein YceI
VEAQGQMTIHGVTRDTTASLQAQLVDGTAVVVGTVPFTFADYQVEKPSAASVVSVADDATIEFQLLFTPS